MSTTTSNATWAKPRRKRRRRTAGERRAIEQEALSRAAGGLTMSNFPDIFRGFMARGIPEEDIRPRENVFTYHAWRALGRQVRKGEKGVRILTWITPHEDGPAVNPETGKPKSGRSFPKATYVFHVSQTDAITEG